MNMANLVKCPLCGTMNRPDQNICTNCQTPLSGKAFQPGQAPVRKDTGELEPILPEWLRDARETARQSGLDDRYKQPEQDQPAASSPDLLAGLQSQVDSDNEEEVPDWLASITGVSKSKPKTEEPAETSGARWVETGRKDDFQQEEETPDWLSGLQAPGGGGAVKDELTTDWGGEASPFQNPFQPHAETETPFTPPAADDTPDWLRQMAADAGEVKSEPAPESTLDWFSQPPAAPKVESAEASIPSSESDTPDWLSQLKADAAATPESQEPFAAPFASDTPDWLSKLQSDVNTSPDEEEPGESGFAADTPDWLKNLGGTSSGESTPFVEPAPVEPAPFVSDSELPSWLAPEESKKSDSTPIWLRDKSEAETNTPAWLSGDAAVEAGGPSQPQQAMPADDGLVDMPDWLKSVAPEPMVFDEPAKPAPVEDAAPQITPTPAFTDDAGSGAEEGLFTEMPDWLSSAAQMSAAPAEPAGESDALAPNALPDWLEAMRPMGQAIPGSISSMSDQTLEQRGALAGLQGVLPAGTGFTPTSKPKSYSNKLSVGDEQIKHAAIFEQILAAETSPEVLVTEKTLGASRGLRWAISAILIGVILTTLFLKTPFLSVPTGVPNELAFGVSVAQAIPDGAPVLVAVDYDASRAGEMEAAAAPLFDNLILLKHPRLTFVSTNEAGSILTERFMNGPLGFHVQNGASYLNLGYLAGGQVGIRAFAQDPVNAMPVDITGQPAWILPMLQDVRSLNQFALIILITDDADAARDWIEQTQDARGVVPIVAITSAQATSMIQPYYDSRQVAGVISGLYGGAIVERQYNSGRPGTAHEYWDAYSIGMMLALALTLGGSFVNLGLGLGKRTASKGAK